MFLDWSEERMERGNREQDTMNYRKQGEINVDRTKVMGRSTIRE
jgi:hypothetical protein